MPWHRKHNSLCWKVTIKMAWPQAHASKLRLQVHSEWALESWGLTQKKVHCSQKMRLTITKMTKKKQKRKTTVKTLLCPQKRTNNNNSLYKKEREGFLSDEAVSMLQEGFFWQCSMQFNTLTLRLTVPLSCSFLHYLQVLKGLVGTWSMLAMSLYFKSLCKA